MRKLGLSILVVVAALTSGCFAPAKHLGEALPPQYLKDGQMPLRVDALYVCQAPTGHGIPGDYVEWIRFWPNGRAKVTSWPMTYRGWPTAADGEQTHYSSYRGRYVVVGDELQLEFLFPRPDNGGLQLKTWFAHLDQDGGFTATQWQANRGV